MSLESDISRAEHAQRLLNDELLAAALTAIRDEVVRAWVECPQRDAQGKEALWQLAKTADKFEALLKGHIESGKLARDHLDRLKEFEKRTGIRAMAQRVLG